MGFWILATLCAYFVKGLCGFADALVFTSLMSFYTGNISITPVVLMLCLPTNALLVYKERKALDPKIYLPLASMVLMGCIPGMLLLKNADAQLIKVLFGIVTILLGGEMLLRERRKSTKELPAWMLGGIGLLSGVLCGLFGIGALLSAYVGRMAKDMHTFKANLCAVFLAENVFRVVAYALIGILDVQVFARALPLYPLMFLALYAGMHSASRLNERTARLMVILMLIISGAALVVKAL